MKDTMMRTGLHSVRLPIRSLRFEGEAGLTNSAIGRIFLARHPSSSNGMTVLRSR
jgi:hypothetical protein